MENISEVQQVETLLSQVRDSHVNKKPSIVCESKIRCMATNMESFALETLTECIKNNIYQPNSILIVGDPGRGKTFLATHLIRHLLSEDFQKSLGNNNFLAYS